MGAAYGAAVCACAEDLEWEAALAVFEDMKQRGLECDALSYSAVISACISCDDTLGARGLTLLEEMLERGLEPLHCRVGRNMGELTRSIEVIREAERSPSDLNAVWFDEGDPGVADAGG